MYGTSRRAPNDPVTDGSFTLIQMDVDDDASVARGIDYVMAREGRLDVVVNNAGIGLAGAIEDTSIQEAQAVLETNFFGTLRVCRAVLPSLRKQRGGIIVNISSIGGQISLPYQAVYSASKLAVEGLSEALRIESKPYGIRVSIIQPGDFHTGFTAHRRRTAQSAQQRVHRARLDKALEVMEHDELNGASPDEIARLLERIINTRSLRLRYTTGPLSERLALRLKPFIPARLFEWAITRYYQLNASAGTQAGDLETGNNFYEDDG